MAIGGRRLQYSFRGAKVEKVLITQQFPIAIVEEVHLGIYLESRYTGLP